MNISIHMAYLSYLICAVFIVSGIPLARNKVKPNTWYGFRTSRTLENEETWYSVNALGGKSLIAAGILSVTIVFLLQQYWITDDSVKALVIIHVPVVLMILGAVYAFQKG